MSQTMHDALARAARNVRSGALSEGEMSLPSTVPTTTVPSGVAAPSMKAAMINAAKEIRKERKPVHKATLGDNLSAIGHSFLTGLADVGSSLYEAADFIIPNEAVSQIFGVEDKVEKFFDARRADKATYHAANDRLNTKASPAVAAANNYVVRPVANMLPAAALAVASGGASLAGDAGAAMLGTAGTASAATGTAAAVKTATTQLLKNPNFWLSFGQISGNTYSDALENGASEGQAVYTALTNGIAGSLIEMGGGIQKGGQGNWFVNTIEEVGEEVSQGWVENGISSVIYDQDKEWFSLTDPDAVFSATRAKDEVIGTVFAAGAMNAGQMGAVKLNQYVQASRLGSEYLNGTDGKTLQEAIEIGLANAPSMDAYKAAQKIQQKANAGQEVSPYLVGRMVAESFAPEAILARQLDALVANTGEALGVQSETIEAVAAVAVRTGRRVEFAAPEQIAAANNVSAASGVGGLYNRDTNTIYVSSALSTDEAVDYVLKHEISHSIETTQAWSKMESLARQAMGEDAYAAAVRDMMAQRQTVGDTTGATETGAKKEVIADWVGKNLWKNNFAAIVAAKDKGLANKLALTMWNIRRGLSFTENGRQTARVKYAEQLLMKAIEDTARTDPALELNTPSDPSGGQYSITADMTEQQRYEELKDRTITAVQDQSYEMIDFSIESLEHRAKSKAEEAIYPLAEKIGILNRAMRTPELDITFELTKGNGLKSSLSHQLKYGGNYADFARALVNIDAILQNAVLIEQHRDKYRGTARENHNLLETSVLVGAFQNETHIVPVQFEVKRLNDSPNKLYLIVAMTKMEAGVMGSTRNIENVRTRNLLPTSTYSLADLFRNINTQDKEFLKYVPDGFLSDEQKRSKRQALTEERGRIESYSKTSGQLSFLPPEMMEQENGKPDIYQEEDERDAYLAADRRTYKPYVSHSADTSLYTRETEQNGAIDENVPRLSFTADFEADVIRHFGITKMNDYIHVQKQVKEALPDSFFAPVQNQRSGKIINITRKGIKETFNNDNYGRIPHALQIAKLVTVELIPEAIANGDYVMEAPNYHEADSPLTYAYIYYDIELQGQPCQLKIDVRRSSQSDSNRLHVHSVVLTNENADGQPEDIHKNETRAKLPSAMDTVYTDDEHLSSTKRDDEYELDEGELYRQRDAIRKEKRTKAEQAALEAHRALLEQYQNGVISESVYLERVENLRREAVADNDQKWRRGYRGSEMQKTTTQDARRAARNELREKQDRIDQENRERRDRDRQRRESKEWTRLKNKLRDNVAAMEHILLHPNEKNAIPTEMIEPFLDITTALEGLFDDVDNRIGELRGRLRKETNPSKRVALEKRIKNLLEHSENDAAVMARLNTLYGDYMESNHVSETYKPIAKRVDDALRMIGTRTIDGLSANEIEQLVSTMQAMMHTAANANTLYGKNYTQSGQEVGEQLEREARENKILSSGWGKKLLTMQLDVNRFCAAMGGFAKNSAWNTVGQEALDGQTRMLEINRAFHDHFAEIIDDKENPLKKLMSTKKDDLVDVGLVDVDGKPILMTHDIMLSIYQQLTCHANRQAIMDGGLEIPDMKSYYGGDEVNSYKKGVRLSRSAYCEEIGETLEAIDRCKDDEAEYYRLVDRLTDLEARASAEYDRVVEKIEKLMTDKERKYCALTREWFDKISKDYINDVTMDVFGFRKAIVEKYFPIYRNTNFVATDFESLVQNATLENTGSLKERVRSKAPVKIAGITNVLMHSEQTTARYCGFLKFTMDVNRLMNVHTKDMKHSVKDTLDHMANTSRIGLGVTPLEYIENLMADIANARKGENSFVSALRRNVIRATMTFNPRVAVKQIGAVFTSAGELGWKYQSKAVQKVGRKLDPAMVAKYSVYFHERMYGSGGMEEFAAMKQGSNIFDRTYRKMDDATGGKLFNWCQAMDNYVCNLLWYGCEAKIRDTHPELKPDTEEFYEAVGKELDRVIQKTQTNYTLMERSDLLRDNRWTMKILSTYKTDAVQGFNMLFEANARYRRYKKDLAAGKGGVTQADVDAAKQQLADTIPAVLVGNVLWGAFAGILMNLLMQRTSGVRDDNDEITAASVGKALLSETLGGMAGLVVFGDQVYDIAAARIFGDNYYGISDMGVETLSGLLEDFATGNFTKGKTVKYLLQDMGKVVGIPLKNAWDIGEGFAKHIEDLSKGEFLSLNADADTTPTQYYRRLYKAMQKGDTEKADEIREFLVTCGKTEAEIQTGLRAAVKKTDKDFQKAYNAAMQEAMEDMFYRAMTEKERKKVASGISGYIADQIVADKSGGELTKANQKAAGYIDQGASVAEYFVANTAKNAEFADKNEDGKVSKAEFRGVMSDAEYDEYLKRLLLGLK